MVAHFESNGYILTMQEPPAWKRHGFSAGVTGIRLHNVDGELAVVGQTGDTVYVMVREEPEGSRKRPRQASIQMHVNSLMQVAHALLRSKEGKAYLEEQGMALRESEAT